MTAPACDSEFNLVELAQMPFHIIERAPADKCQPALQPVPQRPQPIAHIRGNEDRIGIGRDLYQGPVEIEKYRQRALRKQGAKWRGCGKRDRTVHGWQA